MYVQITTRCNMMCDHCCYSCGPDGEDMSIEVFQKALEFDCESVSIGGGEPTIHPQFWQFIGLALGKVSYVWLATNGKETATALALAGLARKEVLRCELSLDEYHEWIDDEVMEAFRELPHAIRDITREGSRNPVRAGRAKDLLDEDDVCDDDETCPCPDFIIKPNGDLMACGCEDAPKLGNIMDETFDLGNVLDDDYEWGECWHKQPTKCKA